MRNRNGSGSEPRISTRLQVALNALVTGQAETAVQAAQIAGMSPRNVQMALKREHVMRWLEERVRQGLRTETFVLAARRMHSLVQAKSEYVGLEAAKHVLSIGGVKSSADASLGRGTLTINLHLANQHQSALLDALAGGGRVIEGQALPVAADE